MSERGYDSDAQFISTPIHIADNVKAAASIGRKGVLPAQPYHNEGNSFLAKDSKYPVYQHTEVSLSSPELEGWSPQAMHGFFVSNEPNVQSPKARGSPRPSASLNNGASSGENNANRGLVPIASASAASLNIFEGKDTIPPTLQEQPGSPGRGSNTPLHTFNLVSPSTERSSELLITKRRQRHQRSTCEDQSIHLADLDISKMLASASTSPVILSPSQSSYENPHGSTSGTWAAQYQGGRFGRPARILTPVWDGGVLKLGVQDARQASSCYSPRTSSASADVPANLEKTNMNQNKREISCSRTPFSALSPNASSRSVSLLEKHVPSLDCGSLGKTDALKSRFTEQFDLNRSITSLESVAMSNGVTSPRKVSIGWMSGGRRLGYGYTVVDGDRDETAEKDSGKASSTRWESPTKPHIAHIIDRLRVSRWSGATALIRPSNASDSASCDSAVNSRTWRRFADRRKNHADAQMSDNRRFLWSQKPRNCSSDCVSERHALGQCAPAFNESLPDSSMESARELQSSQSLRMEQHNHKHKGHRYTMTTANPSCDYAIGRKKRAQTMKLRSPSRKRCRDTASDGVSMSSSQHTVKEENSRRTSQDKEGCIISQDALERPNVQHSHADNEEHHLQCDDLETTLDDWASMYQDCLELYSDPE
ncbi:uncharacterized protein NFIA_108850 [Aspergillus fischeri NRRL 181]|uniref:Uncharacterized protein n=1 Tax=Neosartorya fischeri (strain ATCC 1020 / DSM 3700 / CBS 544.65 / FGSC A1164 / JCM 1740 / NRRL 181 / WB 181) TaxID=331117 RepID=A1CXP0_NEOFI|nr:conserved hypothetical protein [Aspergillus fischeri NRRL 181]EAW25392.1 conserved hypothetical protein [Aspergillus fischeri NRRL 181]KAG2024561.1 hypothetical protein GB937_003753 [Aspergillus fischeri]